MTDQPTTRDTARGRWWSRFRSWPTAARAATYVAMGSLVLVLVVTLAALTVARRPLPQTSGKLQVPGLEHPVEVVRDDQGIPQIYAESLGDLMMAQGFVHAQERFFEMDVRRHYTAGRLSELFGPSTLEVDRFVRTLGWRDVSEREVALAAPATREALQDYAAGVNAYLHDRSPVDLAVEYSLLRLDGLEYAPQRWTPADSLSWLKAMAWDLRGNMEDEIARALVGVDHTDAQVAQLYPPYDFLARAPIVTQGGLADGVFDQEVGQDRSGPSARVPLGWAHQRLLADLHRTLRSLPHPVGDGDGIGSNSWVVDGSRSTTGEPILANDPHLAVSVPGIWMQVGLHCRPVSEECPLDVAGFSFSGVPGVVIGHNADIAWGLTNLQPDVTDLYLERLSQGRWRHGGRWRDLAARSETIKVRGEDDVQFVVRATAHGPLLSDVDRELSSVGANAAVADDREGYAVSLAWTGLTPGRTADAILGINQASNWNEFRAAAAHFSVPAQNLVYADRDGHIGYQAPGQIPVRQPGHDGLTPAPGWNKAYDWTGDFLPFDTLPAVLDPDEGLVVAANQSVIGPPYPPVLGRDVDHGYRSQRIRDLLDGRRRWSVGQLADLQLDDLNPMAPVLVPHLLAVRDLGGDFERSGQDLLRDWDFHQPPGSAAAAYYNTVWANLLRLTFHDELRESLRPEGGQRWFAVVTALLDRPADPWWDDRGTDQVETRDDILRRALLDARTDLTRFQGLEADQWQWGLDHTLELRHRSLGSSGWAPIDWLVNRGTWPVGGGNSIVNATSWDARRGFDVTSAASMRMVVSLADFDQSRWVNLTGVSGHPTSDHYVDQTQLWVRGETLPWLFDRAALAAAGDDLLTLEPALPGG